MLTRPPPRSLPTPLPPTLSIDTFLLCALRYSPAILALLYPLLPLSLPLPSLLSLCCLLSLLLWLPQLLHSSIPQADPLDWQNQIVLVSGGSNGVGKRLIQLLSEYRPETKIISIDIEPPTSKLSQNVHFYQCDVADYEAVQKVADLIRKEVGNPTILINNAGTVQGKYFTELTPDEIKRTIEVNLYGSMWLTKTFLPDMIKVNTGHVLSVSSAAGLVGLAWLTDYCASKFALYGFMESLRQELRHTNIHTTVLCPAHLTTRLFANVHPPYQFITPSLDATYVATKMINALEGKRSRDIWIPLATWAALIVRLSPVWLNDWAHKIMKTNEYKPESEGPFYARPDFMKKKQC